MAIEAQGYQLPPLAGAAGAAFLLRTPPKSSAIIEHPAGEVRLVSGASWLTVALQTTNETDAVRDACWRVAQEALDVHAATHRQAYATRRGDSSFITWQSGESGYLLTLTATGEGLWSVRAHGIVHSAPGLLAPPSPPVQPHPAMRFYRLSQLSDDLFDAFRNGYLALEYLVSEVASKRGGESEADWLNRVLSGPLATAFPSDIEVRTFVSAVYTDGRLPVFHAKASRTIYLPQGPERTSLQDTFETLQRVIASIQHHRLDSRIPPMWARMSSESEDAMARATYLANQLAFINGLRSTLVPVVLEIIDSPRHFGSIWARSRPLDPPPFPVLETINLLKDGSEWVSMNMPYRIPLAEVSKIRIELRQAQCSTTAPSRMHDS